MSSKIKVDTIENVAGSGNVSLGSGHNLVVPGNITGSGDLTVDTNTLHVDSSNNRVGIGTTSPTIDGSLAGLSVNGSGTMLHINNGDGATLKLTDPASGANRGLGITLQGTSAAISNCESGELRFGTGNTERMRIDNNGYVTKSSQPVFSISGGPNSYQDGSGNQTVVLHGQSGVFPGDMNIGGHFSYSNGRFTAPVAGNYMFTYTLSSGDTNSHFIELRKNNASQTTVLLYATQYQSGCHATIYTLAANDYITAQRRSNSYNVYSAIFSGFLLS